MSDYPFRYLIDSPGEGYMEDHGHLALPLARDEKEAVVAFERAYREDTGDHPLYDMIDESTLVCSGIVWLQAGYPAYAEWHPEHNPDLRHYDGREAETQAKANSEEEQLRFTPCPPRTSGARRWWRIEVTTSCGRPIGDDDDAVWCARERGHLGECRPRERT